MNSATIFRATIACLLACSLAGAPAICQTPAAPSAPAAASAAAAKAKAAAQAKAAHAKAAHAKALAQMQAKAAAHARNVALARAAAQAKAARRAALVSKAWQNADSPQDAAPSSGPVVFPEPTLEVSSSDSAANIKASEILGRMDKAYHALGSFSATFDSRSSADPTGALCHAEIAFVRQPERAIATISEPAAGSYVYDGSHIIIFPSPDSSHFTFNDNEWDNLAGSGIAAVFGRLIDDPKQDLLSRMLTSAYQTQNDLGTIVQLNLLPRIDVDGQHCDSLQAILDDGSRVLLVIGASDHMLRRATWSRLDSKGNNIYFVEEYSNIRINPSLPDNLFVFRPPRGVSLAVGL